MNLGVRKAHTVTLLTHSWGSPIGRSPLQLPSGVQIYRLIRKYTDTTDMETLGTESPQPPLGTQVVGSCMAHMQTNKGNDSEGNTHTHTQVHILRATGNNRIGQTHTYFMEAQNKHAGSCCCC